MRASNALADQMANVTEGAPSDSLGAWAGNTTEGQITKAISG